MHVRTLLILVAVALITIAATPATPPKPPVITITKSDGTTVRGQLDTADLKSVSVTQLVKGKPEGEKATIAWADIKSISNGMTRQRVIDQWKKDHVEDRCADCKGEGKVACPSCKGTGRDHASAKDCPTCHGEETIPCTTPKCDHGKIKCPKPHIRLEEGTWYKKPDGKMWRKFPGANGGQWEISEGHVGQIADPEKGPIPCPLCGGAMTIDDPKCHGTGTLLCPDCTKLAATNKCADCDKGKVACKTCNGVGLKPELLN